MPSPFPGMDPYLEKPEAWRDFHYAYTLGIRAALMARLPDRYVAKVEEDIYIREFSAEERLRVGRADAAVVAIRANRDSGGGGAATASVPAPVLGRFAPGTAVERTPFLQVIDGQARSVVTVIELLSPSNKSKAEDRATYLTKRRRIENGSAHLVELDLLRGGPRLPLEGLPACDYYALVSRAEERPQVGLWPVMVRDRLPTIPVPLANGDADLWLDLRAVLDRVYDEAGYARYIYAGEPDPPLPATDAAWARETAGGARAAG